MIRIKKIKLEVSLALLAILLAMMACGAQPTPKAAGMRCENLADSPFIVNWRCWYICDKAPLYFVDGDESYAGKTKDELEQICSQEYPAEYSSQENAGALPLPVLTDPTPFNLPPIVAPPIEHFPPILTGEITYCDPSSRVINFRLVDDFATGDYQHKVMLNGVEMKCEVNSSNQSLLSCIYPDDATFPAGVEVWKGEQAVNEFQYDGSACFVTQGPQNDPNQPPLDCSPVPKPEGCDP